MPHSVSLITTLAAGFALALALGFAAVRLRLPALVGYLLAGIAIGPATPGFVADSAIAGQLAEVGVMLLMFGVGLHFSLNDLLSVRKIALPGALVQMAIATALGAGLATTWGWPFGRAVLFGLSLSVASTVVLLKALEAKGVVESADGRIAVGWLVVEDLAMVLALVMLPAMASLLGGSMEPAGPLRPWPIALGITLAQVAAFVVLMLVVGRRLLPWLLWQVTKTGSRELFTLCTVAAAISIAYGSAALFGVSFALGAFFAGMVLRESEFSQRAAEQTLPLQDAFAVLFFVSVGMLFDPSILVDRPWRVAATVGIIVVGKSLAATAFVLARGYSARTALTSAAGLAQIGEFSFILAALGISLGLLDREAQSLIVAGALISIALNPMVFGLIDPIERWLASTRLMRPRLAPEEDALVALPASTDQRYLSHHIVLVGWGSVGKRLGADLERRGVPFVVLDRDHDRIEALRQQGHAAVWGDATEPETLIQAHIRDAHALVVSTPDALGIRPMVATARELNPGIRVIVQGLNDTEADLLRGEGLGTVLLADQELAASMARHAIESQPGRPTAAEPTL